MIINIFHVDVTVSVPAMLIVSEGTETIQVCASLNSTIESIKRDIIIALFTSDGTGKLDSTKLFSLSQLS